MQDKIATESFKNGYNCAQSVIAAFAPALGISHEQSLKLATGLGAGVNYQGETCGAVLGGLIVLGLNYGIDQPNDVEGKARYAKMADQFTSEFKQKYKTIHCKELLKADVSNPKELKMMRENNVFQQNCPSFVNKAAAILQDILEENPAG